MRFFNIKKELVINVEAIMSIYS